MKAVRDLTQKQLNLLENFSYQDREIRYKTGSEYNRSYREYTDTFGTKTMNYFVSKCYELFTYDKNLSDSTFESFRKCIVKKTCNDSVYQQY